MVPRFTPGEPVVRFCWRPMLRGGGNRQCRVGEGHLCLDRDSVNGFFAIFFRFAKK